jgi:hypothetical protein
LAKSAVDVIGSAFEHTRKQLSEPFQIKQWLRLAVLGLATGEISSGGGCSNFRGLSQLPGHLPHRSDNFLDAGTGLSGLGLDPATIATLIIVAIIGFLIAGLVFLYISSVSRFMLFESVLRRHCELGESWERWQGQGLRFFGWQLALAAVSLAVAAMLFLPLLIPVLAVLRSHREPDMALLLSFVPMISAFLLFGLVILLIQVLTKDFVIPLMAVDDVGVMEGWGRFFGMMKGDPWAYAGYLGMKAILAIGAAIMFGILSGIAVVLTMIPVAIVGVVAVILVKGAGMGWNVFTVTALIVLGTVLLVALLYLVGVVCVPIAVFFPAYAMYFLAERYPALQLQLHPAPSSPPAPPPLSPAPKPIG